MYYLYDNYINDVCIQWKSWLISQMIQSQLAIWLKEKQMETFAYKIQR